MTKLEELSSRLHVWRWPMFVAATAITAWAFNDFRIMALQRAHNPLAATTAILLGASSVMWGAFWGAHWCMVSRPRASVLTSGRIASRIRQLFILCFWSTTVSGILYLGYGSFRLMGAD